MKIGIALLITGLVGLMGILLRRNAGKPKPCLDEYSIAEKIRVPINGLEQGMFIKSRNPKNPVLLFVHGGPGMPTYFLDHWYPTGLDQYFTMCWWEQRGAGLSYSPDIPRDTMTVNQLIEDTLQVARYLRERFGHDKIYLMGHSGGSFIAIQAAARAPGLFHAYIGVAQITHQLRSEILAHAYMLGEYRKIGNARMVSRLEAAPPKLDGPWPAAYEKLRDRAMHELGVGTTREMRSVITGVFLRSWRSPKYTFGEKLNLWRGKFFSKSILWLEMLNTDLTQQVTALELPVYFFHGRHDYTVSYPLAKSWFNSLGAPIKGFYTFEHSAHSPMHEEPARMRQIAESDVLAGTNRLADDPLAS